MEVTDVVMEVTDEVMKVAEVAALIVTLAEDAVVSMGIDGKVPESRFTGGGTNGTCGGY